MRVRIKTAYYCSQAVMEKISKAEIIESMESSYILSQGRVEKGTTKGVLTNKI